MCHLRQGITAFLWGPHGVPDGSLGSWDGRRQHTVVDLLSFLEVSGFCRVASGGIWSFDISVFGRFCTYHTITYLFDFVCLYFFFERSLFQGSLNELGASALRLLHPPARSCASCTFARCWDPVYWCALDGRTWKTLDAQRFGNMAQLHGKFRHWHAWPLSLGCPKKWSPGLFGHKACWAYWWLNFVAIAKGARNLRLREQSPKTPSSNPARGRYHGLTDSLSASTAYIYIIYYEIYIYDIYLYLLMLQKIWVHVPLPWLLEEKQPGELYIWLAAK